MRVVLAVIGLLLMPSSALAAELSLKVEVPGGVRYGAATNASGVLSDGSAPLPEQAVVLETRSYPYEEEFEEVDDTTTASDGTFRFSRRFDRNTQIRVSAPVLVASSSVAQAFVFPAFQLKFKALGPSSIRVTQSYRTPPDVRLKAPTIFYVGPGEARMGRVGARAPVRRLRSGRFESSARIRLPREWDGSFQYASCFRYTKGSGLGDPAAPCPRRFRF